MEEKRNRYKETESIMGLTLTEKSELRKKAYHVYSLVLRKRQQKIYPFRGWNLEKRAREYTLGEILVCNKKLNLLKLKREKVKFIREVIKDVFPEVGVSKANDILAIIELRQNGSFERFF
nr:hypothetical protein [Nanoarchaeota archaeon]